jgi:hypothetical protein
MEQYVKEKNASVEPDDSVSSDDDDGLSSDDDELLDFLLG